MDVDEEELYEGGPGFRIRPVPSVRRPVLPIGSKTQDPRKTPHFLTLFCGVIGYLCPPLRQPSVTSADIFARSSCKHQAKIRGGLLDAN